VQSWNLLELETPSGTRSPIVLHSTDEARAVLIGIDPGQKLGDHQVHERAYIIVVAGQVQLQAGDETLEAGPGTLVRFEEKERHRVSSAEGAKLLMILAPWPGPGHYRGNPERAAAGGSAG
jgi:quercetin dioxygenase-like cupin family protein